MLFMTSATAAPMSCLKWDGDWLDGVSRRECRSIGGEWTTTASPLDKPASKPRKRGKDGRTSTKNF